MADRSNIIDFPTDRIEPPKSRDTGASRLPPKTEAPFQVRGAGVSGALGTLAALATEDNFKEIQSIWQEGNEALDADAVAILTAEKPDLPNFPWIIFLIAVVKDLIDALTGGAISWLASIFCGAIIFLWMFGKLGFARKALLKWAAKRAWVVALAESIPIIGMLPMASIFVVLAHFRETKAVKLLWWLLEKAQGEGLFDIKEARADLNRAVGEAVKKAA